VFSATVESMFPL